MWLNLTYKGSGYTLSPLNMVVFNLCTFVYMAYMFPKVMYKPSSPDEYFVSIQEYIILL